MAGINYNIPSFMSLSSNGNSSNLPLSQPLKPSMTLPLSQPLKPSINIPMTLPLSQPMSLPSSQSFKPLSQTLSLPPTQAFKPSINIPMTLPSSLTQSVKPSINIPMTLPSSLTQSVKPVINIPMTLTSTQPIKPSTSIPMTFYSVIPTNLITPGLTQSVSNTQISLPKALSVNLTPFPLIKPITTAALTAPTIIPSVLTKIPHGVSTNVKTVETPIYTPPVTQIFFIPDENVKIPLKYVDITNLINNVKIPEEYMTTELPIVNIFANIKDEKGFREFTLEDTYVTDKDKEKAYFRRNLIFKSVFGWGQRKLGLALVQFLTKYLSENTSGNRSQVVYAGSATGENIAFVSKLFPEITLHLYDPRDFGIELSDSVINYTPGIEITNKHRIVLYSGKEYGWFNDEIATYWSEIQSKYKNVFFVSDIRSVNHKKSTGVEFELGVWKDMLDQQRWHKIIQPIRSQLKFRLPYDLSDDDIMFKMFPGYKVPYLDGIIYKGVFNKPSSTESRLVTKQGPINEVLYDFKEYESKMFYLNVEVKEKFRYLNLIDNSNNPIHPPHLLNDYNSMAETYIWLEYIKFRGNPITQQIVAKLSDNLSKAVSIREKTLESMRKML